MVRSTLSSIFMVLGVTSRVLSAGNFIEVINKLNSINHFIFLIHNQFFSDNKTASLHWKCSDGTLRLTVAMEVDSNHEYDYPQIPLNLQQPTTFRLKVRV